MKRFLVVGYFGYQLVGDEAVLSVVVRDLRALYPGCGIIATSANGQETSARHGIETVQIDRVPEILNAMATVDVAVLAAAGGLNEYGPLVPFTSLRDPIAYNVLCMETPAFAMACGVPSIILSVGVESLHSAEAKEAVRLCFDLASAGVVRDTSALDALHAIGGDPGVPVTCDPAWTLDPSPIDRSALLSRLGLEPDRPVVGLTLRHWDLVPQRLSIDPQAWEEDVAEALRRFAEETDAQLLMVASQHCPPYIFADDVGFAERFRPRFEGIPNAIWHDDLTPEVVMGVLGVCDVSLAMRHHGAILAAGAGVPTVALAYSPKVRAAFADAGLGEWVIDLAEVTASRLHALLRKAYDDGVHVRQHLDDVRLNRRATHGRSLRLLSEIIDRPPPADRRTRAIAAKMGGWLGNIGMSKFGPTARPAMERILETAVGAAASHSDLRNAIADLAEVFPGDSLLPFQAGMAEVLGGDIRRAEALFAKAEVLGFPAEWAAYWRAQALIRAEEIEAARQHLSRALEANPGFSLARDVLASLRVQDDEASQRP